MSLLDSPRFRALVTLGWAAATLGVASAAHAQRGKQDKCDVGDDNSSEAMGGRLFLSRVTDPKMTNQAQKDSLLRQAVTSLTSTKMDEQKDFGRDYLLAEALVLEAADTAIDPVGQRGSFGFKRDSAVQVDILATADTLLSTLATKKPDCAATADNMRQQAYVPLTNAALGEINAHNYGRADTLAHRAVSIYTKSPYVYNALGSVDITKKDYTGAKENFEKVVSLSASDTNYRKLKNVAMYNLAVVSSTLADTTKGSDHQAAADSAVTAWKAYAAANPSDPNAQAGLTHALQASGDTAQAKALYSDMLSNPSKYTEMQLFQSAIAAAQAKDEVTAVKLFQDGMKTNPYFREALYYVANSEFNNGQIDSLMPTVRRLVSIDPNNPDDYRLLAGAYQLRARDATDPKIKRAMQDSTLQALKKFQAPKVGLTVTNFANDGQHMSIAGKIENFSDSARTYTPKFSFIDATGNIVGSKDASPVTVRPKQTGTFALSADVKGAVAYKYAPLD
jgi:tetratricopeptide (TPR) repeat protein